MQALRRHGVPLSTPAIELLSGLAPDWRADPRLTVEQILGQVSGLRESVDATTVAALGDGLDKAARLVVSAGNDHEPRARWSDMQQPLTGNDLATAIDQSRGTFRPQCPAAGSAEHSTRDAG